MKITAVTELPDGFVSLLTEAENEGYRFLAKMKSEWDSGKNRFNRLGEILYAASDEADQLIGIGGLNIDPYATMFRLADSGMFM